MSRPFAKAPDIGTKFNYLTIISPPIVKRIKSRNYSYILIKCDCGKEVTVLMTEVVNGGRKSCGCLISKVNKERLSTQRGLSKTKEYRAWHGMIHRCYHPSYSLFHRYGGRGISVCAKWRNNFFAFLKDMGPCPSSEMSLDRKNNDKGYSPSNCRWATKEEQSRNRSTNKMFTYNGETKSLKEWVDIYNKDYKRVWSRIFKLKMPFKEALFKEIDLKQQSNSLKRKNKTK